MLFLMRGTPTNLPERCPEPAVVEAFGQTLSFIEFSDERYAQEVLAELQDWCEDQKVAYEHVYDVPRVAL